jgi:hypothetical protein
VTKVVNCPRFAPFSLLIALISSAAPPLTARGDLIMSDSFEYPTGGLNGKNGGIGFGGNPWTAVAGQADPTITAGSMTYTDGTRAYDSAGNKLAPANTSRSTRNLDAAEPVANRTIWVAFRATFSGAGGFGTNHAGFSLFSAANGAGSEFFIGKPGSATNWGVDTSSAAAAQASGAVTAADKDALLVTKIVYGASTAAVSFWVNPAGITSEPALGPADATSTETNFNIVSIRVSTGADATGFQFDEFRVGDTLADVVPEPGCAAGVIGVVALTAGRRSRRGGARQ